MFKMVMRMLLWILSAKHRLIVDKSTAELAENFLVGVRLDPSKQPIRNTVQTYSAANDTIMRAHCTTLSDFTRWFRFYQIVQILPDSLDLAR